MKYLLGAIITISVGCHLLEYFEENTIYYRNGYNQGQIDLIQRRDTIKNDTL